MAALFAVGLPFTYDGTTNHFATTSGGTATVAAVTSADDVTVDGSSGNDIMTIGAAFSCSTLTVNNSAANVICDATHGITTAGLVTLTGGTLNTNNQACSWGSFSSSNTNTRTLTFGSSTITITAGAGAWTTSTTTNLTITANTATLSFTGAAAAMASNNISWNGMSWSFTGSGTAQVSGGTITNFTRTGTAAKSDGMQLSGTLTCSGTFTANGNSVQNRIFIASTSAGTTRTISAATVTTSNSDWQDITAAGAASWNLSAITGGSGDAQGNTGITFTTGNTYYLRGSQTQFANSSAWSTSSGGAANGRIPLPQDNVILDANTGAATIQVNMPRPCANFDATAFTGTLNFNTSMQMFGNLWLGGSLTNTGTGVITLGPRSGSYTILSAGKSYGGNFIFNCPGATYTLGDAFATTGSSGITITNGLFFSAGFGITATLISSGNSNVRTTDFTNSTVTLTGTANGVATWGFSTVTNLTFVAPANITHTGTTTASNNVVWNTGNLTYNNITLTASGQTTISHNFSGGGTVNGTFTVNGNHQIQFSTTTFFFAQNPVVNGSLQGYVLLPGVSGAYISAPDSAALSITGDMDIRIRLALNNWTAAGVSTMASKYVFTAGAQRSWRFYVDTSAKLNLQLSADGTATSANTSSVAATLVNGSVAWLRVTYQASTKNVKFYTASGNLTTPSSGDWTQLGTTQTNTLGSIFDSTAPLELGSNDSGTNNLAAGNYYRCIIYSDLTETTKVFDADLTPGLGRTWIDSAATQFAESSSNAATVTLNGAAALGDGRVKLSGSQGVSFPAKWRPTASPTGLPFSMDYLLITDVLGQTNAAGSGTGLWYAGNHSVNGGDTAGWTFTAPPPQDSLFGELMLMGVGN